MKTAAIILANGFEEGEAIIVIDMLRRYGISLDILSCQNDLMLCSYHNVYIKADEFLDNKLTNLYDAVIIVGGPNATDYLGSSDKVVNYLKKHIENNRFVCALCSAGAKVLARNMLIGNKAYVTSADLYKNFQDGDYNDKIVVQDGNLITGKGLGVTFDFAITIARNLINNQQSHGRNSPDIDWVADHIYYSQWEETKKNLF